MDYNSDDDLLSLPVSFPNHSSEDSNADSFRYQGKEHDRFWTDCRFFEMSNPILKLTTLVRALAEQINNTRKNSERNTIKVRKENFIHIS